MSVYVVKYRDGNGSEQYTEVEGTTALETVLRILLAMNYPILSVS